MRYRQTTDRQTTHRTQTLFLCYRVWLTSSAPTALTPPTWLVAAPDDTDVRADRWLRQRCQSIHQSVKLSHRICLLCFIDAIAVTTSTRVNYWEKRLLNKYNLKNIGVKSMRTRWDFINKIRVSEPTFRHMWTSISDKSFDVCICLLSSRLHIVKLHHQ